MITQTIETSPSLALIDIENMEDAGWQTRQIVVLPGWPERVLVVFEAPELITVPVQRDTVSGTLESFDLGTLLQEFGISLKIDSEPPTTVPDPDVVLGAMGEPPSTDWMVVVCPSDISNKPYMWTPGKKFTPCIQPTCRLITTTEAIRTKRHTADEIRAAIQEMTE